MPFFRTGLIQNGKRTPYYSMEALGIRAPQGTLALLMHFDGSNGSTTFTDSSPFNHSINRGSSGTTISTAQSKFGGASALFDPTGGNDTLNLPTGNVSTNPFCIGTNDFTFECWIRINNLGTQNIWEMQGSPASLSLYTLSSKINWYDNSNTGVAGSATLSTNTWYHVAVVRIATSIKIYLNGTLDLSLTSTDNYVSSSLSGNNLGTNTAGSNGFDGYMDEVRLIVGLGVYTTDFTPPSSPFS